MVDLPSEKEFGISEREANDWERKESRWGSMARILLSVDEMEGANHSSGPA